MSLAEGIRRELGVEPRLVKGANGILDVVANGKLVYSKDRDGAPPPPAELARAIRAAC